MKTEKGARQILIQGMVFVLVGLLWGLVAPHTPYPRLALTAHIQFEGTGVLLMVLGIVLLKAPNQVGSRSIGVMLVTVGLLWLMAFSEVANAWWGTIQMLPIAGREAGATGGTAWQEGLIKLTHIAAGIALIISWVLLIVGFVRTPARLSVE